MRSDSIDRTGRVGDFQWRFFRGSFDSITGCMSGNKPEGSVYSTVFYGQRKLPSLITLVVPVTLLEACEGSMISRAQYGKWPIDFRTSQNSRCIGAFMRLGIKGKSRGVNGDMLSTAATHGLVLFHFSAYPSLLLELGSTAARFFVLLS